MKKYLLLFSLIPVFGLLLVLSACSSSKSKLISVYSVSFYNSTVVSAVGESVDLQYKVFPANATHQDVEFYSLDPSAATVTEEGVATLIKNQSVDIVVRTKDGGFESTCTIVPIVEPTQISVDKNASEEKYNKTQSTQENAVVDSVVVLTVGQTKKLPIELAPEDASTAVLSVYSNNSNIEVVKGVDWLLYGKKVGQSIVTVKYKNITKEIPVLVEPKIANVDINYTDGKTSNKIVLNKNNNIYTGTVYAGLGQNFLVDFEFSDSRNVSSSQVKMTFQNSDSNIFDIDDCDTFDKFKQLFPNASQDENLSFNSLIYITLIPKADGEAKLYVLCDCLGENNLPIQIELTVIVSDSVGSVKPEIVGSDYKTGDKQVALVGDLFSIAANKYVTIGGDDDREILTDRRTYYVIENSSTAAVRNLGTGKKINDVTYYTDNYFSCVKSQEEVRIQVYVAKTSSVKPIYDENDNILTNISDYYNISTLLFSIEEKPVNLCVKYKGNVVEDGGTIAIKSAANATISINENDLQIGILTKGGNFKKSDDVVWEIIIDIVSGDAIEISGNTITVLKDGTADILVTLNDGIRTIQKLFTMYVVI